MALMGFLVVVPVWAAARFPVSPPWGSSCSAPPGLWASQTFPHRPHHTCLAVEKPHINTVFTYWVKTYNDVFPCLCWCLATVLWRTSLQGRLDPDAVHWSTSFFFSISYFNFLLEEVKKCPLTSQLMELKPGAIITMALQSLQYTILGFPV